MLGGDEGFDPTASTSFGFCLRWVLARADVLPGGESLDRRSYMSEIQVLLAIQFKRCIGHDAADAVTKTFSCSDEAQ